MDKKLSKALEFGNYSATLENQKRMLQEKFVTDTIYFCAGGQFTITKELINYCQTLLGSGQESFILIDDNSIPIEIQSIEKFKEEIFDKYFVALNEYHTSYQKLTKSRSVDGLVE